VPKDELSEDIIGREHSRKEPVCNYSRFGFSISTRAFANGVPSDILSRTGEKTNLKKNIMPEVMELRRYMGLYNLVIRTNHFVASLKCDLREIL
jgi:hypothetical protein